MTGGAGRLGQFKPFTIHVADGRTFHVPHRDFLSPSPAGRTLIVYHGDGGNFSILDLLLVTELKVHSNGATAGTKAGGRVRRDAENRAEPVTFDHL